MADEKTKQLFAFIDETIEYFLSRVEGVNRDVYFADRDKRSILDKSINDVSLMLKILSLPELLKVSSTELNGTKAISHASNYSIKLPPHLIGAIPIFFPDMVVPPYGAGNSSIPKSPNLDEPEPNRSY